jgi:hypothetical protein
MASLDSLPADQRAVIQLVLQQGRRYDDIAAMLSIDRAGVRQRALDAFDALGPDNSIPAPQRALLTDYLLGQLPGRVADQVHDGIAADPAQRAWLRIVASEVSGLARSELPAIPAPGARRSEPEAGSGASPPSASAPAAPSRPPRTLRTEPALPIQAAPAAAPAAASEPRRTRRSGAGSRAPGGLAGSSRRGGAILLGVGAVVVIAAIVVILLFALGGSSNKPHRLASSGTTTPTTASTTGTTGTTGTTTSASGETFLGQVNLNSPSGAKGRAGVAQVVKDHSTLAVLLIAQGMPANTKRNAYALWLYNSNSDSHLVGFVDARVGSSGRLDTEGPLPSNITHYKHMLVTLETARSPKTPGPIVLEGSISLSSS